MFTAVIILCISGTQACQIIEVDRHQTEESCAIQFEIAAPIFAQMWMIQNPGLRLSLAKLCKQDIEV